MARFKNVVIRTKEQLKTMGELGKVLRTIGTDRCNITLPDEIEEVPLVYQFCKGKDGETLHVTPDRIIGGVSNIRKDENGDLVGDVRLSPMMRLSVHFQGRIDNLLVAKTTPLEDTKHQTKSEVVYELKQFIVYDKLTVKQSQNESMGRQLVQKTYVAPEEVYDVSPTAGERLHKILNDADKELDHVVKDNTWRGKKVE